MPQSFSGYRWKLSSDVHSQRLLEQGLHPLVARCLSLRLGPHEPHRWLQPDIADLFDPFQMKGMDVAVARIRAAVAAGEKIRIVTDYDVDGTTSSLILQRTLWALGAAQKVDYHIPDRFGEGYGFSETAAIQAAADGISLIITADIGVRDHAAVHRASQAGIDVIICDHHLPSGAAVPEDAVAVLCPPQQGCDYPNPHLAACGVSLKLAQALLQGHSRRDAYIRSMLKVAAIGTVADVVPVSGTENRAIISLGLEELRRSRHSHGLSALLFISGLSDGWITASDLGFKVSPRINAAGRLAGANTVIELFGARDRQQALTLARQLDELNQQRKQIQHELEEHSLNRIPDPAPDFVVLSGHEHDGWHRGVLGIVAARVKEKVHRPVALIGISGREARGSIRSIPSVSAVGALDACQDILKSGGGHPAAAGFSLDVEQIPAFSERLNAYVRQSVDLTEFVPTLELDAVCPHEYLNIQTFSALQQLGPHGNGNPRPVLWIKDVQPRRLQLIKEVHLKFRVGEVDAIWWNGARHLDQMRQPVDLAAAPEINRYRNKSYPQLVIRDAAPSSETPDGLPPFP